MCTLKDSVKKIRQRPPFPRGGETGRGIVIVKGRWRGSGGAVFLAPPEDGADDLSGDVRLELAGHLRELQVEGAPVPLLLRGGGPREPPPRAREPTAGGTRKPAGLGDDGGDLRMASACLQAQRGALLHLRRQRLRRGRGSLHWLLSLHSLSCFLGGGQRLVPAHFYELPWVNAEIGGPLWVGPSVYSYGRHR